MNRYFNNLELRLNSLFADAFDDEFNNMIEQDKPKEEKEEKPVKKNENYIPQKYYRTYSSQSYFNGNEKFEEIREQTKDGDKTYISKIKELVIVEFKLMKL